MTDAPPPLLTLKTPDEALAQFARRPRPLKRLALLDGPYKSYIECLAHFDNMVVNADFQIFNYNDALNANRRLDAEYPALALARLLIGRTGQGDEWFIDRQSGHVLFYDHGQGEYSAQARFLDLGIGFVPFVQLAFLCRDLENRLAADPDEQARKDFVRLVNSLKEGLLQKMPIDYLGDSPGRRA